MDESRQTEGRWKGASVGVIKLEERSWSPESLAAWALSLVAEISLSLSRVRVAPVSSPAPGLANAPQA